MPEQRDWIWGVLVAVLLMVGFALKGAMMIPPSPTPRTLLRVSSIRTGRWRGCSVSSGTSGLILWTPQPTMPSASA